MRIELHRTGGGCLGSRMSKLKGTGNLLTLLESRCLLIQDFGTNVGGQTLLEETLGINIAEVRRTCGQIGEPAEILFVFRAVLSEEIQVGTNVVGFVSWLEALLQEAKQCGQIGRIFILGICQGTTT